MAYTGIAAILLPKSKTIDNTVQLTVPLLPDSTSNIELQTKGAMKSKTDEVIILDEALMTPCFALECFDRALKDIMNNILPFGGNIIIFGGDDRQLLPVEESATRSGIIDFSVKSSYLWQYFCRYTFTENMRLERNEKDFSDFIQKVSDKILNDDCLKLPFRCYVANTNEILDEIYGTSIKGNKCGEFSHTVILAARNVDVDDINGKVSDLLHESEEKFFHSIDSIDDSDDSENDDTSHTIQTKFLNTLSPRSLPPYELRLRKNCVVISLGNINCNEGLCNGTRLKVINFSDVFIIKGQILNGDKTGDIIFIGRIASNCNDEYPFNFERRQFSIRLAFAMSINKAQGQTLINARIDLRKHVFTHGQLYVALSKTRSESGVKVFIDKTDQNNNMVKNIVFQEIFD